MRTVLILAAFLGSTWGNPVPAQAPPQNLTKQELKAFVANVCAALDKNYVFPDKARQMSAFLHAQYQKGSYDTLLQPAGLAGQLGKDLYSVFADSHIRIAYDPPLEKEILAFLAAPKDAAKTIKEEARDSKKNFYFSKLEILPANIGYLAFDGFAGPSPASRKTVHAAMQFVAHADALILDLRNNMGGNSVAADEFAGYFFPARTHTGRGFNRIENKWSEQYLGNHPEPHKGLVLTMPVYILTSSRTFSAAEGLAYTLQSLGRATIAGDTTRGGAHLTRSFSLGRGFVGFIPFARSENRVTHTDWEGTGVRPDIAADEDASLLAAQQAILGKRLAAATDETERRQLTYVLNCNKSKSTTAISGASEGSRFAGRFAEFEVTAQGSQLLFRDANQPDRSAKKMTAITPALFQVGNDYQVEFLVEKDTCKAIRMYWDDGFEETIPRSGN